jgi:hypothetical protein
MTDGWVRIAGHWYRWKEGRVLCRATQRPVRNWEVGQRVAWRSLGFSPRPSVEDLGTVAQVYPSSVIVSWDTGEVDRFDLSGCSEVHPHRIVRHRHSSKEQPAEPAPETSCPPLKRTTILHSGS